MKRIDTNDNTNSIAEIKYVSEHGEIETLNISPKEFTGILTEIINRFPFGFENLISEAINKSEKPNKNLNSLIGWLQVNKI